jgi:N,N'-diacetyllegionaminate synthase
VIDRNKSSDRPQFADVLAAQARDPRRAPEYCFVIGEVAQAHDGSLGIAHSYIDVIADAGADAVKFQTHIAAAESTPAEPWRVKFSRQDASRYDYWRRMEFTEEQWQGLSDHARERGLMFLSSPFSDEAIALLDRIGVDAWKVASGELAQTQLLKRMADLPRPVILSSGMSSWLELDHAASVFRDADLPLAVLQCTSAYPCPPEAIGLNVMDELVDRYACATGLSDHSGTIFPSLAAAARGAAVLEMHVTFSKSMFGPDASASVTPDELKQIVQGVRATSAMLNHPVDKDRTASEMAPLRALFTKSIVAAAPLRMGDTLAAEHLALKKPGSGLPAARLPELIGRRLRRDLLPDEQLRASDVE